MSSPTTPRRSLHPRTRWPVPDQPGVGASLVAARLPPPEPSLHPASDRSFLWVRRSASNHRPATCSILDSEQRRLLGVLRDHEQSAAAVDGLDSAGPSDKP